MSKYFCVFWYPTIFHREKKHRDVGFFDKKGRQPIKQSIADIDEKKDVEEVLQKDLFLQIDEMPCEKGKRNDEECFDLVFTLKDRNKKEITTIFHYYDHSRNGFVIYWYDREQLLNDFWNWFENDKNIIDTLRQTFSIRIKERYSIVLKDSLNDECVKNHTIDWLLISFYHLAKSFYHEHEVHDEADAKLESYYYKKIDSDGHRVYLTEPPSLSTKNNPVINRYLDQYEQMFINYAEQTSQNYRQRKNDIDHFLTLRKRVLEALVKTDVTTDELKYLIIDLRITFDKILSKSSTGSQQSFSDDTRFVESGKKTFPGEDNTPPPSVDEIIKEKSPSSNANVKDLQDELKGKAKENFLPFIDCFYDQVSSLSKICHNALIEYTYCRTLLGSKYNDDYKHDSLFTQSEVEYLSENPFQYSPLSIRDIRRKKAFNIRNSIRYIEDVRQKCSILESTLTKILIEEVHGISKGNTVILDGVNGLTKGNTDILSEVNGLTKENTKILSQVEILEQKNTKTLMESEKSNRMSYALGFISVGLGLISIVLALRGDDLSISIILAWAKDNWINAVLLAFGILCFVPAVGFAISTLWISEEDNTEDSHS